MRRRPDESAPTPPAELLNYRAWCAKHSRRAYADSTNPATMVEAKASWADWERERDAWAAASGVDPLDVRDDQPWDGIT